MIKHFLIFIILFPCSVFADTVLTNNVIGGCDTTQLPTANNTTKLTPVFEPIVYNCSAGQFLPANTTGCQPCPSGWLCYAGAYNFSETKAQGITTKEILNQNSPCANNILNTINNATKLTPVFESNIITLNWNDGTNITTTQCTFGETITIPNPPTRPGYKFGGWRVKRRN